MKKVSFGQHALVTPGSIIRVSNPSWKKDQFYYIARKESLRPSDWAFDAYRLRRNNELQQNAIGNINANSKTHAFQIDVPDDTKAFRAGKNIVTIDFDKGFQLTNDDTLDTKITYHINAPQGAAVALSRKANEARIRHNKSIEDHGPEGRSTGVQDYDRFHVTTQGDIIAGLVEEKERFAGEQGRLDAAAGIKRPDTSDIRTPRRPTKKRLSKKGMEKERKQQRRAREAQRREALGLRPDFDRVKGQTVSLDDAVKLELIGPHIRNMFGTMAKPETGVQNVQTLDALAALAKKGPEAITGKFGGVGAKRAPALIDEILEGQEIFDAEMAILAKPKKSQDDLEIVAAYDGIALIEIT